MDEMKLEMEITGRTPVRVIRSAKDLIIIPEDPSTPSKRRTFKSEYKRPELRLMAAYIRIGCSKTLPIKGRAFFVEDFKTIKADAIGAAYFGFRVDAEQQLSDLGVIPGKAVYEALTLMLYQQSEGFMRAIKKIKPIIHPVKSKTLPFVPVIVSLTDEHDWEREKVADYLEAQAI
jgi:hypothetical protein